ncbi:alpha/beta fold hydrolase [Corynebacterium sp. c9Ua_112]|uniref:Alpha/beta fold hydrolase n=1 Tax=Corynebacterium macclintockiae TaxID=2913501 RepID=A0A9X3M7Q1_9CORY|nr:MULTISPECIES: alpha/beta fold hydrolase [Corynebacterium]MCZ9305499.1 alpha/beta fold hydrolase [Corynebacterium macclintockiae]
MKTKNLAVRRARRPVIAGAAVALAVALSPVSAVSAVAAPVSDAAVPDGLTGPYVATSPVNDPRCVPSPEHPNPVVFIHGTTDNSTRWRKAAVAMSEQGFCTWAFNYGKPRAGQVGLPGSYAVADIDDSAKEIAATIDYILQVTGAKKVDLVGHSQGGLHLKKYIAENGGGDKVGRVVGVAATYHGTTLNGLADSLRPIIGSVPKLAEALASKAGVQQLVGSDIVQRLNALPDTDRRVQYTNLYSSGDTTATPNETSKLKSVNGADVANVEVGATCQLPIPPSHAGLPRNNQTIGLIYWGLTRTSGDDIPSAADCSVPSNRSATGSHSSLD